MNSNLTPTPLPPRVERSSMQGRFDLIFRVAGAALVVVGIYLVLQPFLSALLVAGVLAIATWPAYEKLRGQPARQLDGERVGDAAADVGDGHRADRTTG